MANIERIEKESSGDYTKFLLDETARLEKEFKRLCGIENCKILPRKPRLIGLLNSIFVEYFVD